MMTQPPNKRPEEDAWLDQMLDDLARAPMPDVPDGLMARVLQDADAMLPAPGGAISRAPWWRPIVEALGGWRAVGGLVAAAATGFVVGIGGLDSVGADALWMMDYEAYYESQDAFDAFGWDLEEG